MDIGNSSGNAIPLRGIIFDLDGTLIISTVNFAKFRKHLIEYMKGRGADLSHYDIKGTTVAMIEEFEGEMRSQGEDEEDIERWMDEIDSILNEIELERIEETMPMPGAKKLLQTLRRRNIRVGVLTRSCPEYANRALEIAGLNEYIDVVVARDRHSHIAPKPDPSSVFHISEQMGTRPEETVMIGDHSIDFACAEDSGVRFFGIISDEKSELDLRECGCTEIVSDLDDFLRRLNILE